MRTAEIYKLRTQRNPILFAAAILVGVLIPSVVLIWYTPTDSAAYTDAFRATFEVLSVVLAIAFGGWLLGSEYRHGTVKRLLASEPRRVRALVTKAVVGVGAMWTVLATAAGIGWVAARIVGSMNDVTVPWEGRSFFAYGITALIAFVMTYSLSAITRSDTFATVGTIALIVVFEPLISLVPKVGDHTIGQGIVTMEEWLSGEPGETLATLSTGSAVATITVWLATLSVVATLMFTKRDA